MTATTWNGIKAISKPGRRHGGGWTPLSRTAFEVLAAVAELGPEATGLDMRKESDKRARALALKSWRVVLPDPLTMLFAYNPIRGDSVYVHLRRLNADGLVTSVERLGGYPAAPTIPRSYYSITPLGRIALAYERARLLEESGGRGTLFRLADV